LHRDGRVTTDTRARNLLERWSDKGKERERKREREGERERERERRDGEMKKAKGKLAGGRSKRLFN
jgi:hypothetical protein